MVATGEQNFPVVTTADSAVILAKDVAEGDAADAGITAYVIEPKRLQRSYLFRREDQAVLGGLEEALRADLSMAVSDLARCGRCWRVTARPEHSSAASWRPPRTAA